MRILFVTTRPYLPQKVGGAESSTHDLIDALSKRGVNCTVLCRLSPSYDSLYISNRIRNKVFRQSFPFDRVMGYPVFRTWDIKEAIFSTCKSFKPDVAVLIPCDGLAEGISADLLEAGVPSVLYLHDVEFGELGNPKNMALCGIVANSKFTSRSFNAFFGFSAPPVVHNIFERKNYVTKSSQEYVTFINPVPVKGLPLMLELVRKNPDIPFLFVEGWPLDNREKIDLLLELKSLKNVKWLNRVLDMRRIYSKTCILLVPSTWCEAWGRVVSEAHISSIPVIASNIGGLPEAVGPGGVLVPPGDVEAWSQTLRDMWENSEKRNEFSKLACEYSIRPELNAEYIAERFEGLVSSFIKGSTGGV